MAVVKTIDIDGRPVRFRASAMIPRMYRIKHKRDIFADLAMLAKAVNKYNEENSALDMFSLEVFEDIAYMMAKYGDPENVPEDVGEWLDQFETLSIYKVLPELFGLWQENVQGTVESKKNLDRLTGR